MEFSSHLFSLAAEFESQRAYAQAIKCLTPLCDPSRELPAVAALARLRIATLLLEHFDNLLEAKALLLAAVRPRAAALG